MNEDQSDEISDRDTMGCTDPDGQPYRHNAEQSAAAKRDGVHVGWWHRLMHWLGLTAGYVDHERDSAGVWWMGLRCPKCGKLMHPQRSHYQD